MALFHPDGLPVMVTSTRRGERLPSVVPVIFARLTTDHVCEVGLREPMG